MTLEIKNCKEFLPSGTKKWINGNVIKYDHS